MLTPYFLMPVGVVRLGVDGMSESGSKFGIQQYDRTPQPASQNILVMGSKAASKVNTGDF
jgi:hypothetical protein